jgi:flagellar motor protein MotB
MNRIITLNQIVLAFALLLFANSCKTSKSVEGEPVATLDSPPANYNPVFVIDTVPISSNRLNEVELTVARIDQYSEDKVKLYLNMVSEKSLLLNGTTIGDWSKLWCEVIDSSANGIEQVQYKVREKKESEKQPLAIALVVDHSGSMGEQRALSCQSAIDELIDKLSPTDMMSIIKYDSRAEIICGLTSDKNAIKATNPKIGLQNFGGGTDIYAGTLQGIKSLAGASKAYKKIVVVFTDGYHWGSNITDSMVVEESMKNNTLICAVDYGVNIDTNFMRNLAQKTAGIYKHIYLTNEFSPLFQDVYLRLNNYSVLEYEPSSFGDHFVKIKLCLPDTIIYVETKFNNDPLPGTLTKLNIYYDINKSTIQKTSQPALNKLFKLLKKKIDITIELQGHTDSTGKAEANLKLSQQRAESVRNELIKMGIEQNRIKAVGYGDTKPVATNTTDEGRQLNIRTEFVILTK